MSSRSSVIDRIRRPEYTGDNRCPPCTVVNLLIGTAAAAAVARVSLVAGGACLVAVYLLIYFRGYLVPGTPRLTARYLPARVLELLGKPSSRTDAFDDPSAPMHLNTADNDTDVNPEIILEEVGIIESNQNGPALASDFDTLWQSRNAEIAGDLERQRQAIAGISGISEESIAFIDTEEGVIADADGTWIGTWPSRTALVADVAAQPLLADAVDGWADLDAGSRGSILQVLRTFANTCPACSGSISSDTEQRSISCCQSVAYGRHRCEECGGVLVEQEALRGMTGS